MKFYLNGNRVVDFCDKIIEIFLYILIFCLPFSKAIIEISATFIILAWLTKKILAYRPISTYLNIPILAYILATFLSVILSANFSLSLKNFFSKAMEYIILFFIIAEFISDRRRLKNTVIIILTAAAMIGLDCVFQYFFNFDILRFRHLEAGRITGSFQMPGDLAGYLGPILCLPLALCFLRLKKKLRYFLMIELILLLSLLIFTLSRGAWIGFIVAVCFLGLLENKKIAYAIAAFLLVLAMVTLPLIENSNNNIFLRLKSIFMLSDASSLDRKTVWQVAILMIKDRPIFGHGLSTFMGVFPKYGKDYYYLKWFIPYAHNCYLQIAAETGIVGLISFLTLIATFFVHTINSLKRIKDKFYHAVLSGISAGIIVTLVHSAVDTNLYSLQLSVLFWFMLGLNAALQRNFNYAGTET